MGVGGRRCEVVWEGGAAGSGPYTWRGRTTADAMAVKSKWLKKDKRAEGPTYKDIAGANTRYKSKQAVETSKAQVSSLRMRNSMVRDEDATLEPMQ